MISRAYNQIVCPGSVIMKIITSCFMTMLLYIPLLAAAGNTADQNTPRQLPWEIIAEKFDAKQPFCISASKSEKSAGVGDDILR